MMSKSESIRRWCFSVCALGLFVGIPGYAGQPADGSTRGKARGVKRATIERTPDDANPLSYEGQGIMLETSDGILVFSPGQTFRSQNVGFDLEWDKETIQAARAGEIDLIHVTGRVDIEYDTETSILQVHATDQRGQVFKVAYQLNSRGTVEQSKFLAHVKRFFKYMSSDADAHGAVAGGQCAGSGCQATRADGSVCCTACCTGGEVANCSSTSLGCRCSCLPIK